MNDKTDNLRFRFVPCQGNSSDAFCSLRSGTLARITGKPADSLWRAMSVALPDKLRNVHGVHELERIIQKIHIEFLNFSFQSSMSCLMLSASQSTSPKVRDLRRSQSSGPVLSKHNYNNRESKFADQTNFKIRFGQLFEAKRIDI